MMFLILIALTCFSSSQTSLKAPVVGAEWRSLLEPRWQWDESWACHFKTFCGILNIFANRGYFTRIPTCYNRKMDSPYLRVSFLLTRGEIQFFFFFFLLMFPSGVTPWHLQGYQTPEPPKNHSATGKEWDSLQGLQIEVIIHLTAQSWQMMLC